MERNIQLALLENAERTEQALAACLEREDEDIATLLASERYSLLGGGKRVRPYLINAFAKLFGAEEAVSMPYACALEMIHTYSLIHDDLPCMDDDDFRRGRPSNHKQFGYATALLAGDALLTHAFLTVAENQKASAEQNVAASALIARLAGEFGMIGGQIMDLLGETRCLEMDKLLKLHSMKTGALMECAARLGCVAAGYGPDTQESERAARYAKKIGLAFQIIDDVLDAVSSEEVLGKSVGSDQEHHKTTFLSYYTVEEARAYAAELTAEAVSEIAELEGSEELTDLAAYLLNRDH